MKEKTPAPSGIVLFAKQPGKTSFSSLFTIKHALHTTKVGHTGTLDSFAQGLLVVLSGSMTRLVPYITAFDKTYEAVIALGSETDTLDPSGVTVRTAPLPTAAAFISAVSRFRGSIKQVPPTFSAIHVDGKRASDAARNGSQVNIPPRDITVYSSEIIELRGEDGEPVPLYDIAAAGELVRYAHIRFHVSKGTYIRALARDIAASCGSAGYLAGLLRTAVGSFSLNDAAGCDMLDPFTIDSVLSGKKALSEEQARETELRLQDEVTRKMKGMSRATASECGLSLLTLKHTAEADFQNGKKLKPSLFDEYEAGTRFADGQYAVFAADQRFAGVVSVSSGWLTYQYVVPVPVMAKTGASASENAVSQPQSFVTSGDGKSSPKIITWEEAVAAAEGRNEALRDYFSCGSALTIGGFDGPHAGHMRLFDQVINFASETRQKTGRKVRKGVVTFTKPPHSICSPSLFQGDISTLALKMDLFTIKEFDFVLVIDFSIDFSKIRGNDFLSILKDCCSMQFVAAGCDFRCGYRLDTGVAELSAYARQNGFVFKAVDDVLFEGQRISSSLIRMCVQDGKLETAEKLLGRPYAVDLRNVSCTARNDVHCLLQIANGDVLQILPPSGTYNVRYTSAGARTCNTVLHVDSSLLRLEIPPERAFLKPEKIEFITSVS